MALVKKEIGELLVDNGLITQDELQLVQQERQKTGEPISLILSRLGLATESHLKNALELQYGVNYVSLAKYEAEEEVVNLLPETVMRQHQVVPISRDGSRLTLAMVNPNNLLALDDVKYRLKGSQIKAVVCTEDDFQHFMESFTAKKRAEEVNLEELARENAVDGEVDLSSLDVIEDSEDAVSDLALQQAAEDAPIVKLANQILGKAISRKVSDIHIEPQEKELIIRYRTDGVLLVDRKLPRAIVNALVSRFKVMADLDIAERRVPQDGRIRVRFSGKDIDFRVSTVPAKFGEKVVMRILDKSNTSMGLERLVTDPDTLELIRDMVGKPFGIIFVTGPTGSGKTTTLYSALAERNTPEVNITTAEDPIEYDLAGITQVQVLREKGVDFARILRAFLRQDPDIMLIGETRDKETAKIAVEAALTGHLVFTSLHTNDAPGAVTRLGEMEVENFLIAAATIGIVAQRLVRRVCGECKQPYKPERSILEYIGVLDKGQERLAEATQKYYRMETDEDGWPIFYKGVGCDTCNGSGYKGRVGCYEVMRLNDELREMIAAHASTAQLRLVAKQAGMVPLKDYSLRLVGAGHTTPEEVVRVTMSDTGGGDTLCQKCRNPVSDDFIKCPFCQHDLKKSCKRCGAFMEQGWSACAKCGVSQEEAEMESKCEGCEAEVVGGWVRCPYCQWQRTLATKAKPSHHEGTSKAFSDISANAGATHVSSHAQHAESEKAVVTEAVPTIEISDSDLDIEIDLEAAAKGEVIASESIKAANSETPKPANPDTAKSTAASSANSTIASSPKNTNTATANVASAVGASTTASSTAASGSTSARNTAPNTVPETVSAKSPDSGNGGSPGDSDKAGADKPNLDTASLDDELKSLFANK